MIWRETRVWTSISAVSFLAAMAKSKTGSTPGISCDDRKQPVYQYASVF